MDARFPFRTPEPWSNPATPVKALKWLGREDAPLLYRFRAEWLQWEWGIRFLRECLPSRTNYNIRQCLALADFSLKTLQEVREETGISYDESDARHHALFYRPERF